jgi:hypothetical protein
MIQLRDCNKPCPFFRAISLLWNHQDFVDALTFSKRKFRDRKVPARVLLLLFISSFIKAERGLFSLLEFICHDLEDLDITDQALYQARERIGYRPLWWLRRNRVNFLANPQQDPTCFYHGMRLLAFDGTTLDTADSKANNKCFGTVNNQYCTSAYPLVRLTALCELGTRAMICWKVRKYRSSEMKMARQMAHRIPQGALVFGDRGFYSYDLLKQAQDKHFELFLRLKKTPKLKPKKWLSDGSYLATAYPSNGPKPLERGIEVRVIECEVIKDGKPTRYRFLTTLLDHRKYKAQELANLYLKRWEIETAFDEFKSQLKTRHMSLRAESPLGVLAEIDGLLLGHYVTRKVALEAARFQKVDPLKISFKRVLQNLEIYVFKPTLKLEEMYQRIARRLNTRRNRIYGRCRKRTPRPRRRKRAGDEQIKYEPFEYKIISNKEDHFAGES